MQKKILMNAGLWAAVIGAVFFSFETRAQQFAQSLHGHVPAAIARLHLQPLGDVPKTNRLNLAISLPLRNEAALDSLLQQLYDPASTNYHRYLTPQQFTEQFGPSEQDYNAVVQFAKSNGLTVTSTSFNRVIVDVSGSVDTVEKAFHVTMHTYQHPTENRTFFAPDSEPVVDLGVPISHVSGLDNFIIPRPALRIEGSSSNTKSASRTIKPAQGSGPGGEYMGKDFRAAYAPGVTLDGTGQTVGLLELEGYYPTDIATYEADAGLSSVPLTNVIVDGFPGPQTGDTNGLIEVSLDIEMQISMATNASEIVVFEEQNGGNIVDILNAIAANSFVKQVSSSWLLGDNSSFDTIYQEMAAQGQSFFQASGDNGAFFSGIPEWADDTNITLVGGTTLSTTGSGGAWLSETVWNWFSQGIGQAAGGGGINFNGIPIPSWQQGISMAANQGSTTLRNVPDVALTADNIFVECTNTQFFVGGTSAAAPLWAGFTALINQQATGAGRPPVGFLNPAIYAIGKSLSYTNDFHDITTGNNTNLTVGNKWFAVPGYDLCTGWGTPNGQNLINTLAPPNSLFITPVAGFIALGPLGGPFNPNSQVYTLSNSSPASLTWSLINPSSWLNVSSAGITLAAGGTTTVTISLNSAANTFTVATNATLTFSNAVSGITQNFQFGLQVIEPLVVAPAAGLAASGAAGGPFNPVSQNFSLTNLGSASLNWQAAGPPWLSLSPSSGTLSGRQSASVSAALNANANNLVAGIYTAQVSFTDEVSGAVAPGLFTLSVGQNIVQNGGFETGDFTDWTLTLARRDLGQSFVDNGSQTGMLPHLGTFFAALGDQPLSTLSQTLATAPNQSYLLSLWLFSPNVNDIPQAVNQGVTINTPNQFTVSWNGTILFNQSDIPPFNVWSNLLFVVKATSSSTVLNFGEDVVPWWLGLDDVSATPIPLPNISSVSQVSNNTLALTWNSLPGLVYQVQYSTNLLSTNWFNLSTNTATGTTLSVTNPIAPNGYLFYRVLRLP